MTADILYKHYDGKTSLHYACLDDNIDYYELLILNIDGFGSKFQYLFRRIHFPIISIIVFIK